MLLVFVFAAVCFRHPISNSFTFFRFVFPGLEDVQLKTANISAMPHLLRHHHPGLGTPLIIGPQHLMAPHIMNGVAAAAAAAAAAASHPSLMSSDGSLFYPRTAYATDFGGSQYGLNAAALLPPHHLLADFQSPTAGQSDGACIQLPSR